MERRDTVVNGTPYQMLVPPVRQAMRLCTHTAVLLGPVLGTLGKDVFAGGMDAFGQALRGVDADKADALIMEAVKISHLCCQGEPISDPTLFERHFTTRRSDVYSVSLWALWECVREFFPQPGASILQGMPGVAATKEASESPTTGVKIGGSAVPSGKGFAVTSNLGTDR